jgi:hypothetical protein
MITQQNTTALAEGTILVLLKESSSSDEFRSYLDSLDISSEDAYSKMEKAIEENLIKFYSHKKRVRPLLTLRR